MTTQNKIGFNDKGLWSVPDMTGLVIESDDFTHDVTLRIYGDFESDEQRRAYAQGLADLLNEYRERMSNAGG